MKRPFHFHMPGFGHAHVHQCSVSSGLDSEMAKSTSFLACDIRLLVDEQSGAEVRLALPVPASQGIHVSAAHSPV